MSKTGKPQTYNDIIGILTNQSVIVSAELLEKVDVIINTKQLGYKTREEFIEAAAVAMLQNLRDTNEKNSDKALETQKTEST
jgi:metal-responsive CopG/Arc/MetJ family transcriptional regulator